jgi:TolA-binding protein
MNSKLFYIALTILILAGCKTQEDIRREKTMENINEKITQTQQTSANTISRFQNLEEQITKINGSVEELAHNKGQDQKEVLLLKERLNEIEEMNKKQTESIKLLADKVNEQSKYIEQVVKTLNDFNETKENSKKKSTKEDKNKDEKTKEEKSSAIKNAINAYKSQNYPEAKSILEDLLENSKLKKKDKSATLYYLGLIEFQDKKFEDAKVYFSRLITEIPDSTLNPSAFLNLAKCFTHLKAKDEAKQTIDELIVRYPKSKEAVEAAKIKAKI